MRYKRQHLRLRSHSASRLGWSQTCFIIAIMSEAYVELVRTYAEHIALKLTDLIWEFIKTCMEKDPSLLQYRHIGMRVDEELVAGYLDAAVNMLDEDALLEDYKTRIDEIRHVPDAYGSTEWRKGLWEEEDWRGHVIDEVIRCFE